MNVPLMDKNYKELRELDRTVELLRNKGLRFDILILEIESLTYQLNYQKQDNKNLNLIIIEKDFQIKTLKEQRQLEQLKQPSFFKRAKDWLIALGIGFVVGIAISM